MLNGDSKDLAAMLAEGAESATRRTARRKKTASDAPSKPTKAAKRRVSYKARKKTKWATPATCVLLGALVVMAVFVGVNLVGYARFLTMKRAVDRDTFYPGITVDGVDVSAMSLEDALGQWGDADAFNRKAHNISIVVGDESWSITADELSYTDDYAQILKSAWAVGRYGTLESRYQVVRNLQTGWARSYTVTAGVDDNELHELINAIAVKTSEPAVEATITGVDEKSKQFSYQEGKPGQIIDAQELYDTVMEQVRAGGGTIYAERKTVEPATTVADLKEKFGMVQMYQTTLRDRSDNRVSNIKLACKTISGICVQPGETFSYNGTLGKRTREKGYKAAGALESGIHTTQIGGGICQVSTTLFNAVALSGLEIVERHPHSIPSTYCALGRDATVNWNNQDFKFRNNTDYPIYILAGVSKDRYVIVQIWGKVLEPGLEIKVSYEKDTTFSPGEKKYIYTDSLLTGEKEVVDERRKGYIITTYRTWYENEKPVKKETMFRSYYAPSGGITRVGTG